MLIRACILGFIFLCFNFSVMAKQNCVVELEATNRMQFSKT